MQKIAIDLLPIEFRAEEVKRTRFYKVQFLGIAVILVMVFLTSLTVVLRILQGQRISQAQIRVDAAEEKISSLKNTQGSLLLLKNRLTTINQFIGKTSKQTEIYNIIEKLLPASSTIRTISVDKSGEALVLATVPDGSSLDNLINSLLSKDSNEDKIKGVSMESLSRDRDGIYKFSFKVKPQ